MIEFNGKHLCENCFEESMTPFCTHCGYNPAATASDPTMLKPGSILLGKYIVGKVMGKGGFGVTYLAYDVTIGKKVAIKEFFPYGVALRAPGTTTVSVASMENADAFKLGAEKFYNEAQLVSRFNGNPNIVGVYEFFYENDTVYFAMEYLKGHTLKEHIEQTGPLTSEQGLFVMQNVANALMAAHSSNVLHRDISPDNIIVCDNGDIKLIDFGAARQVVAEHSQSFSVILKPGFAPLEQYQKKGNQGPWTDIYSLGATIYYAITTDILEDPMSRFDDDEEYKSNQYSVNPELWEVITKATELKLENRYGDVFQLKNDLAKITFAAQPLVVPNEPENKMPEFDTAKPFGMTQPAVSQPSNQPVGVGAPAQMPEFAPVQMQQIPSSSPVQAQAPAPVQAQAPAPVQSPAPENAAVSAPPAPNETSAPAKKSNGKIAGICAGVAAVVAAAIIIPIAVNSNKDKPHYIDDTSSTKGKYSTPSVSSSSTPSTDSSDNNGGSYVTNQDLGDGKKYTGEWKNGMPQGEGQATFGSNSSFTLQRGTFVNGKLSYGSSLQVGSNGTCFFSSGEFGDDGKLAGEGYIETRTSSLTTFRKGTINPGNYLVKGEYMRYSKNGTEIWVGSFGEKMVLVNGYHIKFTSNGDLSECFKVTNGTEQEISLDEAAKISELKIYDADYISNVTSNSYGYKDIFNQMAKDIETMGGPVLR